MAELDVDRFARLIAALRPWLGDVVIIGGWAHRLYRLHPLAQALGYPALLTLDTDVALPPKVPVGKQDIRARLLANGFEEEFLGDDTPPVTHYRLGGSAAFYVEFLTPLVGSGRRRGGKRVATARVAGVSTQKLRYLDLLVRAPWSVELEDSSGFPLDEPTRVRIPSATSYIAQKILAHAKRSNEERAKDFLYIHDTIELFGRSLPQLHEEWKNSFRHQLHGNAVRMVEKASSALFRAVNDIAREAALMAAGRSLSAAELVEVCRTGCRQIFCGSESRD